MNSACYIAVSLITYIHLLIFYINLIDKELVCGFNNILICFSYIFLSCLFILHLLISNSIQHITFG